jgi:hypothetical protein
VAFNRFEATADEPAGTEVKFQVAVADAPGGNCAAAAFSFVGPDSDPASFFYAGGPIPLDDDGIGYENPGRCFRYKAYLSTSHTSLTPVLYDVTVNYSP